MQLTLMRKQGATARHCSKCKTYLEPHQPYRMVNVSRSRSRAYCLDCSGFIMSRYSMIELIGNATPVEIRAKLKYFDQAVDWAFGKIG